MQKIYISFFELAMILFTKEDTSRARFIEHVKFKVVNDLSSRHERETNKSKTENPLTKQQRHHDPTIKREKQKMIKINLRNCLKRKRSVYNIGRWSEEEHRRFIEAILKFGNEWKNVQRHIKTRSSTQSRSHSQKFFLKIQNYDMFDFKGKKPGISALNDITQNLDEKEISRLTELLISYEYQDLRTKDVDCLNNSKVADRYLGRKRDYGIGRNYYEEKSKSSSNEDTDDFKNIFLNIFNTDHIRRISFEDNLVLICNQMDYFNEDTKENSKDLTEEDFEEFSVDSFVNF